MNKYTMGGLLLSFTIFSAQAGASVYANEGVFVLDSTGRFLELFKQNKSRFTLDHPQGTGYEAYGPEGFREWLAQEGVPFIDLESPAQIPGDTYPSFEQMEARLLAFQTNFPNLAKVTSIGRSGDGKNLYVVKISNHVAVDETKPEVKYISSMHGDEITGRELMMQLIEDILNGYGRDARITRLVDNTEIYIMPSMNPDGSLRRQRANAASIDLNRDFPDFSTDNRNTPDGRAIETKAIMKFQAERNFALSANFHGGAEVVNYPWDTVATLHPFDALVRALSTEYASRVGYIRNSSSFAGGITNGYQWYEIDGGMQDWSYHWYNDLQITIELSNTKWPSFGRIAGYYADNKDALLTYLEKVQQGAGFKFANGSNQDGTVRITQNGRDLGAYDFHHSEFYKVLEPGVYEFSVQVPGAEAQNFSAEVKSGTVGGAANYKIL